MEEVWKKITLANDYYIISTTGTIKNTKTGRVVRVSIGTTGYPRVGLRKNGKTKDFKLHRLLLETFVGPCPSGMECRHLDGNRLNFSLDNLKWGTRSENCQDAVKHGTINKPNNAGSKSVNSKLSDEQVLEIYSLASKGETLLKIAKRFGVSYATVWSIKERRKYKYLWSKPTIPESK